MVRDSGDSELELRDYLRVLRRRKGIILLTTVVAVGAALALSYSQTPVYKATAEVLVQPRASEQIFTPEADRQVDSQRAIDTEIKVLESRVIEDAVREQLGRVPNVSASSAGETDVISISVRSTNKEQAASDVNAYAETYIEVRRRQAVDDLLAAGQEVQAKIDDLQRQIALVPPEPLFDGDRQRLEDQRAFYRQQLDQLQVAANVTETGGGQVVTEADTPSSPVEPKPVRNGLIALALGLVLGVGLAFLRDYLDDTIKSKDDLQQAGDGITVIGVIPRVRGWKNQKAPHVVTLAKPSSHPSEAYRTLRTSIQFLGLDKPLRVLQVTSASKEEGKTATIANLAVTLAQAGTQVVLVDCDLRRPRLHEFFGARPEIGFTSVLLGDHTLSEALHSVSEQPNLALLSSGPIPPDPSELLTSPRTAELVGTLGSNCDLVLVDSPPVLPVSDALVLAGLADATLLVASAGQTTRSALSRAIELLRQ
ncbi:MAG: polysaccharide biosynthesis tyrosine autokinase, partial [Acidimicrobiia bacterium]